MTSVAERKRHRRAAAQIARGEPRPAQVEPGATVVRFREKTGLEWLRAKGKLSERQARAGHRYGADFRVVRVSGMEPLRSCLHGDAPGGSGGGLGLSLASYELEARERLAGAQAALSFHPEMTFACDEICGRDRTPWEVIAFHGGGQRDAERLVNALRIACDILAKHYG